MAVPAGSFKWERFVRSSLASSIAGFINGGRLELLSTCNSACVVSISLVFYHIFISLSWSYIFGCTVMWISTNLAILQHKNKLDFVAINQLLFDLGGYPALSCIWLPGPRPNLIVMCHCDHVNSVVSDGRGGGHRVGCCCLKTSL